jgi:hypothetical protein
MMALFHDLKLVVRTLVARWRFSLLVIATMAVGIGTTVGVWAYLAYFVRPTLDAPDPSRLLWVENPAPDDRWRQFDVADWRDLELARREVFTSAAASKIFSASLQSERMTLHVFGTTVSGDYFELLGARPALGRLLEPRDDRIDAQPVLVLSNLTWRRHFGGDRGRHVAQKNRKRSGTKSVSQNRRCGGALVAADRQAFEPNRCGIMSGNDNKGHLRY